MYETPPLHTHGWGPSPWRLRLYVYPRLAVLNFILLCCTLASWGFWWVRCLPPAFRPYFVAYLVVFVGGFCLTQCGILPFDSTPPVYPLDEPGKFRMVPEGYWEARYPPQIPVSPPVEVSLPALPPEEHLTVLEYIGYFGLGVGIALVILFFEYVE